MTQSFEVPSDPSDQPPDYNQKLADLFTDNDRPELPRPTHDLAVEGFNEDYENYKDRPYHNGEHPIDVLTRQLLWMEYLADKAGIRLELEDYEVAVLGAPYHDNKLNAENGVSAEKLSAQVIADRLRRPEYEGRYKERFIKRVTNSIESTEVEYKGDDVLLTHVLQAEPDIAAVSLVLADIAAVVTEDGDKIIVDASKLAAEKLYTLKDGQIPLEEVMAIFDKQPKFTLQRFLELPAILDRHLGPEKAAKVLASMQEHIQEQRKRLLAQAALIADHHDYILKQVEPVVNNPDMSPIQKSFAFAKVLLNLVHSEKPL